MEQTQNKPKNNTYKKVMWAAGLFAIFNEAAAVLYAYHLAFMKGSVNIEIFVAIFLSLLATNSILMAVTYYYRSKISRLVQLTFIIRAAIVYGFYGFTPLILLIILFFDSKQLSILLFLFVWEVPIIGGIFLFFMHLLIRKVHRAVFGDKELPKEEAERLYGYINNYPLIAGISFFCAVILGAIIGGVQMVWFGQFPSTEVYKLLACGIFNAVLFGIFISIGMDRLLNSFRYEIRKRYGPMPVNNKKFISKIVLSFIGVYTVSFGLSGLIITKQFQFRINDMLAASITHVLEEREVTHTPEGVQGFEFEWIDDKRGHAKVHMVNHFLKDSNLLDNYSLKTIEMVKSGEIGKNLDTKNDLKLIINTKLDGSPVLVETQLSDYYGLIRKAALGIALPVLFVFFVATGFSIYYSFSVVLPMRRLGKFALQEEGLREEERHSYYTGDEFEEFANILSYYRAHTGKFTRELEKKVYEKTHLLSDKLLEIEEQNKILEDTKKATLNILEDSQELQEELKKQKENVEHIVEERTKALREKTDDLQKAKDEISTNWVRLQEEKARLTSSINSLPYGFLLTDMEGFVISVNKPLQTLLKLPNSAINLYDIQHALGGSFDLIGQIRETTQSAKASGSRDVSFGEKYLTISAFPIITSQEPHPIGSVVLVQDVTEKRVLERSRDEFFSIASHELRTPLTAIRGNTSLIKEYFGSKLKDPQLVEMINDIYDSSTRLIDIVNDFLDVSRLEQKRIEFENTEFDITELVEKVLYELKGVIEPKKIYAKMDYTLQAHPHVYADKNRTKQILYNLIGNSTKFTEKGGITVSFKSNGRLLEVRITDTGKGIPLQSQSLLFRKFQQASNSMLTRDSTRGTGMGLYISRLLAQGMGGDVILEHSEENVGTTFLITFPLSKENHAEEKQQPSQS